MYFLKYVNLKNEKIIAKSFNTKQELEEYYQEFKISNKLLISNEWYRLRGKKFINNEFKFIVTKEEEWAET